MALRFRSLQAKGRASDTVPQRGAAALTQKEKRVPYAQLPKPLIEIPISNDAKLLFALLSDRFQLSLKTGYKDEDGYPYCIFSNKEICAQLHCAHDKATKLLRELEKVGLIRRRKYGRCKPDRIYVGSFRVLEDGSACGFSAPRNADFPHAGTPKTGTPGCRFSAPIHTEKKQELSIYPEENKARLSSLLHRLDLPSFSAKASKSALRQITEHIETVMRASCPTLRISGRDLPAEEVRKAFDRLTRADVQAILDAFKADPLAFGSMRARLFEAGRRHGTAAGIGAASNDSWAHEAACPGIDPLKPLAEEDTS